MFSPPERSVLLGTRFGRSLARLLLVVLCAGLLPMFPAQAVDRAKLHIARIDHPAFQLTDLAFSFDAAAASAAIEVGLLNLGGRSLRDLRFTCAAAQLNPIAIRCSKGRAYLRGRALPFALEFDYDRLSGLFRLRTDLSDLERIELTADGSGRVSAVLTQLSVATVVRMLDFVLPQVGGELAALKPLGSVSGTLDWRPRADSTGARLEGSLRMSEAGFSSADGLLAAEGLGLHLEFALNGATHAGDWRARLDWQQGAAYVHPFFLEAGPVLAAQGRFENGTIAVHQAALAMEGVDLVALSAELDLASGVFRQLAFAVAGADLAVLGPHWLAPVLSPSRAEDIRFAGLVSAEGRMEAGRLVRIDVDLDGAGFSMVGAEGSAGFAIGPVSGVLPWRPGETSKAKLQVQGGRWEKLVFGAFELDAAIDGSAVRAARIAVPVLDGAVVLAGLVLQHAQDGWRGEVEAVVEPMSMRELTAALDMPLMSGVLSASMPKVRLSPGEISLDGALVISVFDGYLQATGFRLLEPFGVASHLVVDVEGRHLDLAQLTETFSFGSVSGFVDLSLKGLELARWRPVAFDARIKSSPGRYPKRISQRAVQNISALGGAGAVAAIQRSMLSFFNTFGYRELGLHCVLRGDVCHMSGIEGESPAAEGFTIVHGGGIPALDVIGYNRRVDWPELLDRLQRVIEDNVTPEVR